MFRGKHSQEIRNEGFSGKNIASQLGERWRNLNSVERKNYGFQAFTIKELNISPEKLDRTTSVIKLKTPEPICTPVIPKLNAIDTRRYSL